MSTESEHNQEQELVEQTKKIFAQTVEQAIRNRQVLAIDFDGGKYLPVEERANLVRRISEYRQSRKVINRVVNSSRKLLHNGIASVTEKAKLTLHSAGIRPMSQKELLLLAASSLGRNIEDVSLSQSPEQDWQDRLDHVVMSILVGETGDIDPSQVELSAPFSNKTQIAHNMFLDACNANRPRKLDFRSPNDIGSMPAGNYLEVTVLNVEHLLPDKDESLYIEEHIYAHAQDILELPMRGYYTGRGMEYTINNPTGVEGKPTSLMTARGGDITDKKEVNRIMGLVCRSITI